MLNMKELKNLLAVSGEPAFSLYVPLGPRRSDGHANRLRLRDAVRKAIRIHAAGEDPKAFNRLARSLEAGAELTILVNGGGTLALFQSPALTRSYHLPAQLPEQVFVGPNFHIRPLMDFVLASDRFWVLELSKGRVRVWIGDTAGVRPAQVKSLPTSPDEVLGYEYARDYEVVHRGGKGAGQGHGRGRAVMPVFSGHGVGSNDRDDEARQFFKAVDDALAAEINGSGDPIILAATTENDALYRSVSRLENLADVGIRSAVHDWEFDRLHRSALPIAAQVAGAAVSDALQLWEDSFGRGNTESDPAVIARHAVAGRIRLLLAERGRWLWGTLDRDTGAVSVEAEGSEASGPAAVDILDELTELTILHGGRVLVVSPGQMPVMTGVAAVLR